MLGYFLTAPLFGYLGDRMSRKGLIVAGVLVWSAGTLLSGWAPNLLSLLFFRVLVGLGEASYGTISPGWIADLYAPERRNLRISIFYVAIPVGSALGFILGGFMAAHFGWRSAFLWAGAPGLLLALLLLGARPRGERWSGCGSRGPGARPGPDPARCGCVRAARPLSGLSHHRRRLRGANLRDGRLRLLGADLPASRPWPWAGGSRPLFWRRAGGDGPGGHADRWRRRDGPATAQSGGLCPGARPQRDRDGLRGLCRLRPGRPRARPKWPWWRRCSSSSCPPGRSTP